MRTLSAVQQIGIVLMFLGGFQACFPTQFRGLSDIAGRIVAQAKPQAGPGARILAARILGVLIAALGVVIVSTEPIP